jgi:hypothetical protein
MSDFSVREPTCQELAEFLTEYLEGALGEAEHTSFDRHIAGCRDCTLYIEQMRVTIAVTGRIRSDEIPSGLRADLLSAFRRSQRPR